MALGEEVERGHEAGKGFKSGNRRMVLAYYKRWRKKEEDEGCRCLTR